MFAAREQRTPPHFNLANTAPDNNFLFAIRELRIYVLYLHHLIGSYKDAKITRYCITAKDISSSR